MSREKAIEQLKKEIGDITEEQREMNERFIESLSEPLKRMAKKYNLDAHKIYTAKEGAPYRTTHAGSVLSLFSITEEKKVGVLCWWSEDDRIDNVEELLDGPIKTFVDPQWLEEIA